MIVVHCSGSRCDHRYTMKMLRYDHVHNNGWTDIGYHFYITLDGVVHACRPVERMGSHALGYNAHSIGICYEGGLSPSGCISDTRTPEQKESMKHLIQELHHRFPGIRTILGHRDLPGVQKACPCFDATKLQYTSWMLPDFLPLRGFFKSRIPPNLFNKLGRIQSGCALFLCRHISFIQHSTFNIHH